MSPALISEDTFLNKPGVVASEVTVFLDLEDTLVVAAEDAYVTVVIVSERGFSVL